ncbi:MAG: hypothetical protein A2Y34_03530 [Spirochaetes bacterium GWC1_27_15]|nr:MAG: hypothetical protein A2Y34_03530 [Spirochaetes bacterium GWC1_27_15]
MLVQNEFINYYDILQIEKTATDGEVKKAYKKMVLKFHPDVNKEKDTNQEFKEILKAYSILKDTHSRKQYDEELQKNNTFLKKINFKYGYQKIIGQTNKIIKKFQIFFNNIYSQNTEEVNFIESPYDGINISKDILYLSNEELERRLLYSNNIYVKIHSALALGIKKNKSSLNIIEKVLLNEHYEVQRACVWALGNLQMKKSIGILKNLFNNCNSTLKLDIIKTIFKITKGHGFLINNLLKQGLKDNISDVKAGCIEIMLKTKKKLKYNDLQEIFSSNIKEKEKNLAYT